ncbi:hypothetical protein INT46_008579 [Mucor plumbeus]|uniref:Chromosome segregation in meiosis protein 3 domain-containing protein n=1 Tax=Mucor plumbeus TaxID=97098 RepID=A0A8H7V9R2_9FUNG|nr:hypothetical protein INT46_008579 [Mucor plumbeus]
MNDEFDDILLDDYNIDTLDKIQPNEAASDDSNDEVEASSLKKKHKKFDDNLLLEPKGIYLLKNETQYLKFSKKKGQEDQDLSKLMTYYTVWANNLYPSLRFKDFSRRVLTPAKSKLVRSVMDNWSNEYRDRRQIRLAVRNELSGKTVGDEDGSEEIQAVPADEESSEDDNRPLFFPITSSNKSNAAAQKKQTKLKPKSKPKSKETPKPRAKAVIDSDNEEIEDERPLFTPSQQQNKRKIVLDDSSDDEDTYNMSRSNALALIIERKRKREQAQREEQEKSSRASRPVIENYDEDIDEDDKEDDTTLFNNQDQNLGAELALSANKLSALGLPVHKPTILNNEMDDDTAVQNDDIELALSDNELLALGLPINKPTTQNDSNDNIDKKDQDIELDLSDNELLSLDPPTTTTATTDSIVQDTNVDDEFSDNELFDIKEA